MITLKIWHGPMRTTLALPLREAEIQKELVKAFRTAPFKVTADNVSPEALAMLNGKEIDLDELNFLAKSLDRFTPYEQEQFLAAVQVEQPSDLKSLINLSFNMERYTLVQNVTDLAAVGRKYLLNKMGALPASEIDKLDFEQAGRDLLTSGNGTPTICAKMCRTVKSITAQLFPTANPAGTLLPLQRWSTAPKPSTCTCRKMNSPSSKLPGGWARRPRICAGWLSQISCWTIPCGHSTWKLRCRDMASGRQTNWLTRFRKPLRAWRSWLQSWSMPMFPPAERS